MFTARLPAIAVPVPDHLTQNSILIHGRFSVGDDEDIVSLAAVSDGADIDNPVIELTCPPFKIESCLIERLSQGRPRPGINGIDIVDQLSSVGIRQALDTALDMPALIAIEDHHPDPDVVDGV